MPVAAQRMFKKPASDREAWNATSPQAEAKSLLGIAKANAGVEAMRELIAVTERQRWWLKQWMREQPDVASQIEAAIAFRAEVLAAFDELASR